MTGVLAAAGFVHAFVPIALGLTTTALGTLLPILRDNDMLEGRFGRFIMAAGAVDEFMPIVGIAVFLSANGGSWAHLPGGHGRGRPAVHLRPAAGPRAVHGVSLRRARDIPDDPPLDDVPALRAARGRRDFGLDVVLGAFLAGVVLRRWAPGNVRALEGKLDAVGYGFFIPVFFVSSGMSLDLQSIAETPAAAACLLRPASSCAACPPCSSTGTTSPCGGSR